MESGLDEEDDEEVQATHLWCISPSPQEVIRRLQEYCSVDDDDDDGRSGTSPSWMKVAEEYLCSCAECLEKYQEGKATLLEADQGYYEQVKIILIVHI